MLRFSLFVITLLLLNPTYLLAPPEIKAFFTEIPSIIDGSVTEDI